MRAELLVLSKDLRLPVAAVTERLGFLGRTGSGKTYAAQKLAEEMHRAGAQFVVLDPVGVWYGLRLAADGKGPGLQVPVLGGLHGDIPLEATGGALIANLVVDRGVSMVLDVSQFESDADKARFAQAFADRFFFRKKASPSAVHLFIEEAQEFCPQNPQREEARMLHAFTRLVKIGRNFGIGVSLISQRPQEVNKKVLNLTELLFCFQLTGPQERKTIQGWIAEKGIDEDIAAELPKLDVGQPHVWSPAWLKISERVRIAPKKTLDVSATPIVGQRTAARDLSPIDLEGLRTEMAATIERAKAEDPRELRRELAALKAELARVKLSASALKPAQETRVEVPVLKDAQVTKLVTHYERVSAEAERHGKAMTLLWDHQAVDARALLGALQSVIGQPPPRAQAIPIRTATVVPRSARVMAGPTDDAVGMGGMRRILVALAQRPQGLTLAQIGVRAGLSSRSGTFSAYMSRGRQHGWIQDGGPGAASTITDAGLRALGSYDPLPTGQGLLDYWLRELGTSGAARILQALADVYPNGLTLELLGERAELNSRSGTFSTYLSRLRALQLIEGRGQVRASAELFS